MKSFLKEKWSSILILLFVIAMLIPQTRLPLQVFLQRMISFSPSEIPVEERTALANYNWELETLQQVSANLSKSKNRLVLINFWATWCAPCIAEMPSLQNLYNKYGDRVDFYFVSQENPEIITKFLQKRAFALPIFIETHSPPIELQTQVLPTTFLISKDGTIVIKKSGVANWDSDAMHKKIDKLLQ